MTQGTTQPALRGLNKRTLAIGVVAVIVLIALMFLLRSDKPPERCPNTTYRPGEVREFPDRMTRTNVPRIIGSDCQPSAAPATPEQIIAARERMAKWQAYETERLQAGATAAFGSSSGGFFSRVLSWIGGPIGSLFLVVFTAWALLFGVALTVFLIGFLVVAVLGLRHAPLAVLAAPILIWWKVLIELPTALLLQIGELNLAKAQAAKLSEQSWRDRLKLLLGWSKPAEATTPTDLGSADYATAADIEARSEQDKTKKHHAPLHIGEMGGEPLTWHTDKHVLVLAGSRTGKGRDILIPNLLRYQGSAFIIDPKGENYRVTADYRRTLGSVRVLDPWRVNDDLTNDQRASFNPLALLTRSEPESVDRADVLAHGLVLDSGTESHWSHSARALWKALLLHVATADEFASHRDLITARRILLNGFLPTRPNPVQVEGEEEVRRSRTLSTLEHMAENAAFEGIISDFALSLLATPEKERGSIISYAARQTDFLDTPALRRSLAASGDGEPIAFSEWRTNVMSCYVCIPADKLEGSGLRWVRLVVSAALNEMLSEQAPPALPVQFILDELASLKRPEQVERAIGLAAGYGVQIWAVWQDLAQMKDLYSSRWSSFIGNAGVRYVFGINDFDTAKYISDYLGAGTREIAVDQSDALGIRVTGQSRSLQARPLMTPDEVMVMAGNDMLVLLDRMRPLKSQRVPWFDDSELAGRTAKTSKAST
jgi:type IV secretion system protein VirD4